MTSVFFNFFISFERAIFFRDLMNKFVLILASYIWYVIAGIF